MADDVTFDRIPAEVKERWTAVRAVCEGDQALRVDTYLPQLNKLDQSAENLARNAAYRERAVLYAATGFTLEGMVGLAFVKDPSAQLPDKLDYLKRDADGGAMSLYQQSQSVLSNIVQVGRHGLYVDYSSALSRPVIKSYIAEDIINWRTANVGGQLVLTMVVLREEVQVEGNYSTEVQYQYREIRLVDNKVEVRVWVEGVNEQKERTLGLQKQLDANAVEVDFLVLRSKAKELDAIPFVFIGSKNNDPSIDPAPLYSLAKLNIAHFRNSADFEDSVFYVGQAQPWISGLDETWRDHLENPSVIDAEGKRVYTGRKMYIGSRSPLLLPNGGAFGFAQPEPNSLVESAMHHKEEQMVALGARLISSVKTNKTATGEDNDREANTSILSLCCSNVSEAYQTAIAWCAQFLDLTLDETTLLSTYKLNQDFIRLAADAQLMAQMVSAWQLGVMAKTDVRAFYRRLGLIATERTDEDIDSDVDKEGPQLGAAGREDPLTPGGQDGQDGQ